MIELIPATLAAGGVVPFDTATTTATGHIGPLGYAANAPLGTTDAVDAADTFANGVRFTGDGRLRLYDATGGLPAGATVQGGMAVSATGQLCITTDAVDASTKYIGGVAVTQDGRVHATV